MSRSKDGFSPDFSKGGGLVAAIAQDFETREVLMIAWMNKEAFDETVSSGNAVYYSRSRKAIWRKGEQSGHVQRVKEIRVDCDTDAVLLLVEQHGAACHEGYPSCFYRKLDEGELKIDAQRLVDPKDIY